MKLKAAADTVGKPVYMELSSVNPIVILPGALAERGEEIATELTGSCLMGTGQFCTNPGLIVMQESDDANQFITSLKSKFAEAPVGTLLSKSGQDQLGSAVETLVAQVQKKFVAPKRVAEKDTVTPIPC